jgi:hypothetical protein
MRMGKAQRARLNVPWPWHKHAPPWKPKKQPRRGEGIPEVGISRGKSYENHGKIWEIHRNPL